MSDGVGVPSFYGYSRYKLGIFILSNPLTTGTSNPKPIATQLLTPVFWHSFYTLLQSVIRFIANFSSKD